MNSVWLNFYHLLSVSKKPSIENGSILSFPWILWQIWKARNAFVFEQIHWSGSLIFAKASEEASTWMNFHILPPQSSIRTSSNCQPQALWVKPPAGTLKCNVASSWINPTRNSGAAWLVRNSDGIPLFHSRRAFCPTTSPLEAELNSLWWAVEAMHDIHVKRVIVEVSSDMVMKTLFSPLLYPHLSQGISRILRSMNSFDQSLVTNAPKEANSIALQVASSVTRDQRFQSYMANGGPNWLSSSITAEAVNARSTSTILSGY